MKKLLILGISCLFSLFSIAQKKDSVQVHADTTKKISLVHTIRSVEFTGFGRSISKNDGMGSITFFQERKGIFIIGTLVPWGPGGLQGLSAAIGVPITVAKKLLIMTPAFGFSQRDDISMLFALRTQSQSGALTLNTLTQIDHGSSVTGTLSMKVIHKISIGIFGQYLNFRNEKDDLNNDHTFIAEAGPQVDFHLRKFTISGGGLWGNKRIDHNHGYDHNYSTTTLSSLTKRAFVKVGLNL